MRTKLRVSLDKIKYNLDVVRQQLPQGCKIIAVVKANAYGHGDIPVSTYIEKECDVHMFAVASLGEALSLRNGGIKKDILVLSYVDPEDLAIAIENNVTLAIISPEHAIAMSEKAVSLGKKPNVHLKLNTGMNRVGFDCKTFKQLMAISGVYKLIFFTHLFCRNGKHSPMLHLQLLRSLCLLVLQFFLLYIPHTEAYLSCLYME